MFARFRKRRATSGEPVLDGAPRRPLTGRRFAPTPGALRRERKALLRARDERIVDLGGLMLEMYRRNHYREELVFEQCSELVELEERILELDELVAAAFSGPWPLAAGRCACGVELVRGVHFCANCGRPAGKPVVSCAECGHPLAGDARFCAACGTGAALRNRAPAPLEGLNGGDAAALEPEIKGSPPTADSWER